MGQAFQAPARWYISPYDAEKHVWVVDDHTHAIYKFTNDEAARADDRHAERAGRRRHPLQPSDVHGVAARWKLLRVGWYNGTRVAKFDANGTFQFDFGMRGEPGKETRPGT